MDSGARSLRAVRRFAWLDNAGTLYVVDCNNGSNIDVFPRGATKPAFIMNDPWAPSTGFGPLVADSKGQGLNGIAAVVVSPAAY